MFAGDNHNWLEREGLCLASAMQRTSDPTFGPVIVRGQGSRVWDAENCLYFDLTCGYSAANFGHAFQPLVSVAREQLERLTHVTGLPHPGRAELAERLVRTCGGQAHNKVLFNTSGSRAVESAWKAAVSFRPGAIVALTPAYHGRSLSTSALSDTPRIASLEPPAHIAHRRPLHEFPYCAACPLSLTYPSCELACQRAWLDWLESSGESVSAVIVEPALGARGYIAPPAAAWQRLREVTARNGILMIADEIQTGLGRCGDWLLSRMQGWQADLVVLGKSLGGGITPISAVVGRAEVLDAIPAGTESETFAASPLATAVGCEVHRQLETGNWFQRAGHIGRSLANALRACSACRTAEHPPARIETLGASAVLEFYGCQPEGAQSAAAARRFAERLVRAGLLIHYSGPYATRIVLLPALTITDEELAEVCHRCATA